MNYIVKIYFESNIKDFLLCDDMTIVTIGSSEFDTIKLPYDDVFEEHLKFKNEDGVWSYFNKDTSEFGNLYEGISFILSEKRQIAVAVYEDSYVEQKVKVKPNSKLLIGRSMKASFHLLDRSVSSEHAIVVMDEFGVTIKDLGSLNGTYINGKSINQSQLNTGDIISIGKYNILFDNNVLVLCNCNSTTAQNNENIQYPFFSISPRLRHKMPSEIIEIKEPPNIGNMPTVNWLSFLPMLATRSAYSAVFPLTSVLSTFLQKKKYKKLLELRRNKYETYLSDVKAKIDKKCEEQFLALEESNHETYECLDIVINRGRTLWERSTTDDDFMKLRIGKGDIETSFQIKFQDSVLKLHSDDLESQSENLGKGSQIIEGAPILCDFQNDLSVGLVGERENVVNMARNIIVQATTTHSYKDLKIVTVFSKKEQKQWDFVKWLPHSFDEAREFRYVANDVFNVSVLDKFLIEELKNRFNSNNESANIFKPFYLFVITDRNLFDDVDLSNYLNKNYIGAGIGVVYAYSNISELPKSCNVIVETTKQENIIYNKSDVAQKQLFEIDRFTVEKANRFAREIAPIRLTEKSDDSDMPTCITFLEGYGVKKVEELPIWENWNNTNPSKSITVPLGVKSNGEPFMFNIMYGPDFMRYHGSHGLVAGATRSGKSEMVQSWILSLAMHFSPEEISFIIIDYKGTGMLQPFEKLPHLAGKISNLDGNVYRNIIAINQEIKRRQLLFDRLGIKPEIKEYFAKGYHKTIEPMPAIIVVVDEFAEVKNNLPEFVPVLESLFAVGSALGIWVIISTQKPSGVVTDKMYANANFRWCCRVASSSDSKEMLHHADAAKIKNAGRAFVQVGEDDIYEQVQSYWSGAPYLPDAVDKIAQDVVISSVELNGKRVKYDTKNKEDESKIKQIDAIVEQIRIVADEHNIKNVPRVWKDKLPSRIYINDILEEASSDCREKLVVTVGKIDDPYQQDQYPLNIDFSEDGHCIVYGAPSSGKTTFLQTFMLSAIKKYSPEKLNIYCLDFGSWSLNLFSTLPHVGGVANNDDYEKIEKLIMFLKKELDQRKRDFALNGVINIESYEKDIPFIVLVVDNFSSLFALYPEFDEFFIKLTREGANYGIFLIATNTGTNGISYKISSNVKNNIALQLKDKTDYPSVVGKTNNLEPEQCDGRGLIKSLPNALEFQTALPAYGDNDKEVLLNLKKEISELSVNKKDGVAKPIPIMPDVINYNADNCDDILLGLSADIIDNVILDLEYSHCIAVSSTSIESNIFKVIVKQFKDKMNSKIYLVDAHLDKMVTLNRCCYKYLTKGDELDEILEEVRCELDARKNGTSLSPNENILIAINGFNNIYDDISEDSAKRLIAIIKHGKKYNVNLLVSELPDELSKYVDLIPLYKSIINDGINILEGGTFASHSAIYTSKSNLLSHTQLYVELGESESYILQNEKAIKFKEMKEF